MRLATLAAVASIGLWLPALAGAQTILTKIMTADDGTETVTEYTYEDLAEIEQVEVVTDNDYIEAPATFIGTRLRDIFAEGEIAEDGELTLVALNDYSVTMPASDALDYDVILATEMDGTRLTLRDKGPIWLIYPMTDNPELREAIYNDRLIWQLAKVVVR